MLGTGRQKHNEYSSSCASYLKSVSLYHLGIKMSEVTAKEVLHVSMSMKSASDWRNNGAA